MNLTETNLLLILPAVAMLLIIALIALIIVLWSDNDVDYGDHDSYELHEHKFWNDDKRRFFP